MQVMSNQDISHRRFYATDVGPCPYLEDRQERRLVTVLDPSSADNGFDLLISAGFRRSQHFLYKPACVDCRACIPVRIDVERFRPGRTFRKLLKANADLEVTEAPPVPTQEQFELFQRYLEARHSEGGMAHMSRGDFQDMVAHSAPDTRLIELRSTDGKLIGVSITDYVRTGLSGVYKFFAPEAASRSLGTYLILWHVSRAQQLGLPYVYLGYWIADCRKMAYKSRFRPMEQLDGWQWIPLVDTRSTAAGDE